VDVDEGFIRAKHKDLHADEWRWRRIRENVIQQIMEAARPETLIEGHAEDIPGSVTLIGGRGKRKTKYLGEIPEGLGRIDCPDRKSRKGMNKGE
jgi:hypothetical protein